MFQIAYECISIIYQAFFPQHSIFNYGYTLSKSKYEGFKESESMVLDNIFSTKTDPNKSNAACNFDIILGHSQGAILTAALLSIHDKLQNTLDGPLGYILNGVAWPNPYHNSLKSLAQQNSEEAIDSLPRMMFVMGKMDNINPIESARQVHDAFQDAKFDVSIVHHDGGHSVPIRRDEDAIRAMEEIADWIVDIAKEKLHISSGNGV